MIPHLILVGCTKSKRDERAAAADLYDTSDLFRRRRQYATEHPTPWAILSALHGIVDPTTELEPYDYTMADRQRSDYPLRLWALDAVRKAYRITGRRPGVDELRLEVHAGIDYVRALRLAEVPHRGHLVISHPVEGLGIGAQKAYYSRLAAPVAQLCMF
jgi:hypothetical protein